MSEDEIEAEIQTIKDKDVHGFYPPDLIRMVVESRYKEEKLK